LLVLLASLPAQAATFYVCGDAAVCGAGWSTGADSNAGMSKAAPLKTLTAGIGKLSSGSTLIVGNGVYAESLTGMPSGTAAAYTVIRAENDWGVLIDGSSFPNTFVNGITVNSKRFVVVRGFRVKMNQASQNNLPVQVAGSDHVKLIRCAGSHGPTDGNAGTFDIGPDSDYVLVEECFAYGGTRYMFITYWSDHTVFRRNVARNDYWAGSLQSAGFVTYDSVNSVFQNNIALDSDAQSLAGGYYGGFWGENKTDHAPDTSQVLDGNIVLHVRTSTYAAGVSHFKMSGTFDVRNLVLWDSDSGYQADQGDGLAATLTMRNVTIGATTGNYDAHNGGGADGTGLAVATALFNTVRNSIFFQNHAFGVAEYVNSDYNVYFDNGSNSGGDHVSPLGANDLVTTDPRAHGLLYLPRIEVGASLATAGEGGGPVGARITHRLGVAGTLYGEAGWDTPTQESLWPFPNEAEIKRDMGSYSGPGPAGARGFCAGTSKDGSPQTLTKYIWEYLGNTIPAEIYACAAAVACAPGDGCCPTGCTHAQDGDCQEAPPLDGGTSPSDGGASSPDGGASSPDGGASSPDGGASSPDGGPAHPSMDGGAADAPLAVGGCGCSSGLGASWLVAFAVGVSSRLRRPRRTPAAA
jgi:hypothetical protein